MLKNFGIGAMAALLTLGILSISEAASSNDNQTNLCCRGNYCYNQNYQDKNRNGDYYCDGNGYECGRGYCYR